MEKKLKLLKTITIVLLVIAVSLISFIGVFRKKSNFMENIIPEIKYGMELSGNREFKFTLDTASEEKNIYVDKDGNYKGTVAQKEESDEKEISLNTTVEEEKIAQEEVSKSQYKEETKTVKANEDSVLNKDSYEKTKSIIQKRLDAADIPEYNIRLDTIMGNLILEVPDDESAERAYDLVNSQGKFEIIDEETGVILLDNSHLKKVQALYTANEDYQVYLQIEFNVEGAEILKQISKEYVKSTDESGEEITKKVALKLDEQTLLSTYFGEELSQGILQITMGSSSNDEEEFLESYNTAKKFANILSFGETPNRYTLESDNFIQSQITSNKIKMFELGLAVVIVIISVFLIIKYKIDGVLGAIAGIGYIALTILAIRYTNVIITVNSILALIIVMIFNYVFIFDFLNKKKTDSPRHAFSSTMKKLDLAIIPLCIVAIVFSFAKTMAIASVGNALFWGLIIYFIYKFIVIRALYV